MRVTSQPRFQKENFETNLQLVQHVKRLAAKKGVTPGQLALAWVHHQVCHLLSWLEHGFAGDIVVAVGAHTGARLSVKAVSSRRFPHVA